MHVEIRMLGGFAVAVDGRPLPERAWRRRAATGLVKLLALQPGRRLRREQVVDALWPDLLLSEAAPRLHMAAHYARTALGSRDAVVLAGDAVTLLPGASVTVDVDAFDTAAELAVADGGAETAAAALERYAGDLLPDDLYEAWAEDARYRRRVRYLELLRNAGRWHQLLEADPLDEEAHLRLAEQQLRSGRRSAALRQLAAMEEVFQRELGVGAGQAATGLRDQALALPEEDGEQGDAPAWATPLPLPPTPTVGREHDLRRVLQLLDRSRIVTLLGPGGVGKTRLALEVGRRRGDSLGLDTAFVDLTRACRPESVPGVLAVDLGVRTASADPERSIVAALEGRSLLVVLDNVEHVVEAAGIVGRLAARLPGLQFLCTSRARLRLGGEQVYDVAPLPVDLRRAPHLASGGPAPAVALFEQAARAVDPDFSLAAHLDDVVGICRSVDGLPLAIELAAGHVRTLPPAQLRRRLHSRLGSPSGGARDNHPRQQTITATVDWSLQLLGPAEQRLFPRLGVFAGAVPLELIESVCGGDGDVVEALSRLVDQSLVRRGTGPGGEARFRLLAVLRERARALLPRAEADRLRLRHAAAVTATVERMEEDRWTGSRPWMDEINGLLPEIRLAHREAETRGDWTTAARITAALGAFWHREGHHAEGREWAEEVLRHTAGLDELLVARLHLAAGMVTWTTDLARASQHWGRAVALSRRLGSDRYLASSLSLAAVTRIGDDARYAEALALADEAIALAREVGEAPLLAQSLNIKGELARVHGDDALARSAYEEGLDHAALAHDDTHLSMLLSNLGYLAVRRGDHDEGRRLKRKALDLSWSVGRRMVAAWFVSELAAPELGLGNPELAAVLVGAADQALLRLGAVRTPGDRPEHERVLGELTATLGDSELRRLFAEGARLPLEEAVRVALAGDDDGRAVGPPALVGSVA